MAEEVVDDGPGPASPTAPVHGVAGILEQSVYGMAGILEPSAGTDSSASASAADISAGYDCASRTSI